MRKSHEDFYKRTIDKFMDHVQEGRFTDNAVPRLANQLRDELAQCIEIGLISPEFYSERMEVLGRVLDLVDA